MQPSITDEIKRFFFNGSVVARLLGINIGVFLLISLVRVLFFLLNQPGVSEFFVSWLGVPSNALVILSRPWTIITYMFVHLEFFHILFNMIVLYVGGRLFSDFIGANRLTGTYIIGGIIGGLAFILSYNVFPVFQDYVTFAKAIGASASVLAIFVAIATYMPDYQLPLILFGRVKLKYIAIVFVVIDLISIDQGNPGGHLAHLGGALWGFIYARMLRKGKDPALSVGLWVNAIGRLFKPKPRMKVEYRSERPKTDEEYSIDKLEHQKKLDKILEKISNKGYESLTKEEKELLFKESNKR